MYIVRVMTTCFVREVNFTALRPRDMAEWKFGDVTCRPTLSFLHVLQHHRQQPSMASVTKRASNGEMLSENPPPTRHCLKRERQRHTFLRSLLRGRHRWCDSELPSAWICFFLFFSFYLYIYLFYFLFAFVRRRVEIFITTLDRKKKSSQGKRSWLDVR
ncbi:hypothetical protein VTO42DRAFT_8888 [Malbranchea cinnamomea]